MIFKFFICLLLCCILTMYYYLSSRKKFAYLNTWNFWKKKITTKNKTFFQVKDMYKKSKYQLLTKSELSYFTNIVLKNIDIFYNSQIPSDCPIDDFLISDHIYKEPIYFEKKKVFEDR